MKIMMLAQFYPPIIGGEERITHDLSVSLASRGHEVSVVTLWHPGMIPFSVESGVRVYRVKGFTQNLKWLYTDDGRRLATPYPDPGVVRRLDEIIKIEKPDIVHGHNWMVYSFFPLKRSSGAALVLTLNDHSMVCAKKKLVYMTGANCDGPGLVKCMRCSSDHYGPLKGIPTALGNFAMAALDRKLVDCFTAVSHSVAVHSGLVKDQLPFEVVPNFTPDDGIAEREIDQRYLDQLPQGDFMLFVGAFGHYKGVDVLIEAYRGLNNALPLVLIGYTTTEYPVQTTDLPDNVFLLRDWPHDTVMAAWRRSVIGLVPSNWLEPFGIVALEAMATGTPLIASRIGGLVDIVDDGETGLLVEAGNADALRDAMQRLIDNPALREQMGMNAKKRVERFSETNVIAQYERIYGQVLKERGS